MSKSKVSYLLGIHKVDNVWLKSKKVNDEMWEREVEFELWVKVQWDSKGSHEANRLVCSFFRAENQCLVVIFNEKIKQLGYGSRHAVYMQGRDFSDDCHLHLCDAEFLVTLEC